MKVHHTEKIDSVPWCLEFIVGHCIGYYIYIEVDWILKFSRALIVELIQTIVFKCYFASQSRLSAV